MKQTDTPTLIKAMRVLAREIQSGDGVANAAIAEAADRLEEQYEDIIDLVSVCESFSTCGDRERDLWRTLRKKLAVQ